MTLITEANFVLSDIIVYPIKSARGVRRETARVGRCGFEFDRQWMLVDREGDFLTQRQLPRMALLEPQLTGDQLTVDAPGMERLSLPLTSDGQPTSIVRIWDDRLCATPVGAVADAWFSAFLETPCSLVRFPETTQRHVDPTYSKPDDQVGFADGFPFLLISEASLASLNARLEHPLLMNRFRPNLVVSGCAPYAEDGWKEITVGNIDFRVVKPCARCSITTVDQATGHFGKEPLQTLAGYRRVAGKVMFGQNLIHNRHGLIRIAETVHVEAASCQ